MQIGVYGSGYLGTVISACLADFGTPVSCCHPDRSRMVEMAQGNIPFFEKNLKEIIRRNVRAGRLAYSTDIESFARKTQVIFLAEDKAGGPGRHRHAHRAARVQASDSDDCDPGSRGHRECALEKSIKDAGLQATIVSQPMFFTDGCAVEDFNWPDRIILGSTSNEAVQMLKQIFHPLVMRGVPVIVTNQATAELVREAATAFVATKISFINEVAALCERVNADAVNLALALGLDKKIAPRCLQPGAGMGGVFAESDMDSLAELAQAHGVPLKVLSAAREVNHYLADRLVDKIALRAEFGREQGSRHSGTGLQAQYEFSGGIVVGAAGRNAGFQRRARSGLRSGGDSRSEDTAQRHRSAIATRPTPRRKVRMRWSWARAGRSSAPSISTASSTC